MTNTFRYAAEDLSSVTGLDSEGRTIFIPRNHRIWFELEINVAEENGEILEWVDPFAPSTDPQMVFKEKLTEINLKAENEMHVITSTYPDFEMISWGKQEAEARKYKEWVESGSTGDAPSCLTLDAIALARSLTLDDLVDKVIFKADAFASQSGSVMGYRQSLEDQLEILLSSALAAQGKDESVSEFIESMRAITWSF